MLQIQLNAGAVKLAANQTLRVLDGAGRTLCALDGALWITEENQPKDIVLEAGGCYQLQHPGVALVNSLSGEAAVAVS